MTPSVEARIEAAEIVGFLLDPPGLTPDLPDLLDELDAEHAADADGWCAGCGADDEPTVRATACPVRPWVDLALRVRAGKL